MLIKFTKQTDNSFAKIIKTSEMELFHKSLLASEASSESCETSKMEVFAKIVKKRKAVHYFNKNLHLECLVRF